jgi:hypothetical protein
VDDRVVEIVLRGTVALQKLRCYNRIMNMQSSARLTDEELILGLRAAASHERAATAQLIALLAEMDTRRLYLAEGFSSLFVYCTQCLRLSEHAAYGRIEAARAARKFPLILQFLTDASITLTTVCLLASHLTVENYQRLLGDARCKTKREVEMLIATLAPKPAVASMVRKLPTPKTVPAIAVEAPPTSPASDSAGKLRVDAVADGSILSAVIARAPAVIAPLAPERYKVQITISRETHDRLRRVQALLRHVVPSGDPALIFDRALSVLLQDLERRKLATVHCPRASMRADAHARHVPAAVKRDVWRRDEGRCAFVGTSGRCAEEGFLELHHLTPFAEGGPTTVDNLQLRCRAHNAYEAREHFGSMLFRDRPRVYELGPGPS